MATIRKFKPKTSVIETSIEGFFIKSLSIAEQKEIAKAHSKIRKEDLEDEKVSAELTMKLFGLACNENGEQFDEFKTIEEIEKLSVPEFNMFANAIKEALAPGEHDKKK